MYVHAGNGNTYWHAIN